MPRRLRRRATRWSPGAQQVVVQLSGEVTSKGTERIEEDLKHALRSEPRLLEFDLLRVTYLDGGGARVFLTALRAAQPLGTR
ncbi:STAS domain-containing protein (plasmid) [Streptomyces sp. HUAS TT11]|uniref:STAS domain-containing protein n=1 Tax=Streptomyces sp. HUAS TT11 TaxID=3447508 RepID=UPI003F65A6F5